MAVLHEDRVIARHGRPRPVGGRFALPSLRFSGAAMAMSTVLGISAATTWLVSAQQHIGRRPTLSTVGASPPLPSPDAAAPTVAPPVVDPGPREPATPATTAPTSTHTPSAHPSPPAASLAAVPLRPAQVVAPSGSPTPTGSPSASPSPSPTGTPSPPTVLPPKQLGPTPPPTTRPPDTLTGQSSRDLFGPSGARHTVTLTVGEPLTALLVELRLERPEALPGTAPWSNLPGAVVTVTQERGTLVYRFAAPAGPDVQPGRYTFGVRGARQTAPIGKTAQPQESWVASAFAPLHPRALAVRGTFG